MQRGRGLFAIDSGTLPIANADQIETQAADWVALRRAFPGSTINLRATVSHPGGQLPIQEWGHSNVGVIQLPAATDYTDVTRTITTLAAQFPRLAGITWTVSAGREHPADIKTSGRFPSASELDVWEQINADQSIAHRDKLTINGRVSAPVWLSEETPSHDANVAAALAQRHLSIVATLPRPVLYTASDAIQGHINGFGRATGPGAVTVGGCTDRDYLAYRPPAAEQALVNAYEACPK